MRRGCTTKGEHGRPDEEGEGGLRQRSNKQGKGSYGQGEGRRAEGERPGHGGESQVCRQRVDRAEYGGEGKINGCYAKEGMTVRMQRRRSKKERGR